jgi:hypothetical protein
VREPAGSSSIAWAARRWAPAPTRISFGCGGLLEPGGQVHALPVENGRSPALEEDFTGLDAGVALHPDPTDRGTDLQRGAERPLGVVLVRDRDTEGGHDRVARVLLDGARREPGWCSRRAQELRHATASDLRIGCR